MRLKKWKQQKGSKCLTRSALLNAIQFIKPSFVWRPVIKCLTWCKLHGILFIQMAWLLVSTTPKTRFLSRSVWFGIFSKTRQCLWAEFSYASQKNKHPDLKRSYTNCNVNSIASIHFANFNWYLTIKYYLGSFTQITTCLFLSTVHLLWLVLLQKKLSLTVHIYCNFFNQK